MDSRAGSVRDRVPAEQDPDRPRSGCASTDFVPVGVDETVGDAAGDAKYVELVTPERPLLESLQPDGAILAPGICLSTEDTRFRWQGE